MIIQHEVKLDLVHRGCDPIIHVTQGDTNVHQIHIKITKDHRPWSVPDTISALVHYSNSYGSGGSYSLLPDGSNAGRAAPTGVQVTLVPEMMALPGAVHLVITLKTGTHLLSPCTIQLMVAPLSRSNASVLANYSNISGFLPTPEAAKVNQILQVSEVDEHGHITQMQAVDLPEISTGTVSSSIRLTQTEQGVLIQATDENGALSSAEIFHGNDGISPHIGSNGNWFLGDEDTGISSCGAAGKNGQDGYTPVKGIDYCTEAEKAEWEAFIASELAKRGQLNPELASTIEECTDPTKLYVLPDGYIYAYMFTETEAEGYKNWIPYSTVSGGGSIYNGTGYKLGYRLNSSAVEKELSDCITFGFIPVTKNSVVRITNFAKEVPSHSGNYIHLYDSSYTLLTAQQGYTPTAKGIGSTDENGVYTFTPSEILDNDSIAFMRVSSIATTNGGTATDEDAAKFIITVDQEITDNANNTVAGYAWTNTGHAFVPADYEDRILALENAVAYHIPDYWIPHLQEKAEQIQIAMEAAGRNKSAFLWYTDAHWPNGNSRRSPLLLRYLCENTPMNKVNFGGDIVGDSLLDRSAMSYVYKWRKAIRNLPNHHSVIGNHDNFADYAYAFLIAPEESSDMVIGGDFYYYIDSPCEKTRYLYLDSGKLSMSDDEAAFVIKALKDTPDEWHIVVISHLWFHYNAVSTPTVGGIPAYCQKMLNLFDAYNSRGSGSVTMVSAANAYDFTNCGGKVEFCIGGHIHVDHDLSSAGGIPVIITTADANQDRVPDSVVDSGAIGTITESAVFGIIADYTSNQVTVVGVGRGTDRVLPLQQ